MSVFPNLDAELARHNIRRSDVARDIFNGRTATVSDKLNGKYPLLLEEAIAIRDHYFPQLELGYLFEVKEKEVTK